MAVLSAELTSGFLRAAELYSERTALEVGERRLTYEELRTRATAIARTLISRELTAEPQLTAVFGSRSPTAYAGILGVLLRNHGYVPLNPRFPAARNRQILERAGCSSIVVDRAAVGALEEVIAGRTSPLLLVLPDEDFGTADRRRWAPHTVVGTRELEGDGDLPDRDLAGPAYLLFTSGSTGTPKGVLVSRANVRAFLDAIAVRHDFGEADRFSQMFDLTFDLSAFDMFVAWEHGACVCCPDVTQMLKPSGFIQDSALTVWFSVPSVAMFLERLGGLKPGTFPALRLSLFCGEALPADIARQWARAAPNSVVENLYGPTEATIACIAYSWKDEPADVGVNGLVPIGKPFGDTVTRVVDDSLREVQSGQAGQLLLSGPQVVGGYWNDTAATARSFVQTDLGHAYLTGDRVVQRDADAPLEYLGRLDSQIKVLGYRVELEEVEAVIREESGGRVVAVGWPRTASGFAGLVAFVADCSLDHVALRRRVAARLPDFMVPREFRLLSELPLNANGKRDRNSLIRLLENE
jgi:amino acid adenylation domain-containing protein